MGKPVPAGRIHGLFSGGDFDATIEDEKGKVLRHNIGLKDKISFTNDGESWTTEDRGTEPRDGSAYVVASMSELRNTFLLLHTAGREVHDGNTWLHLSEFPSHASIHPSNREFWLELDDAGEPIAIRRCTYEREGLGDSIEYIEESIKPAEAGDQIKLPATGK